MTCRSKQRKTWEALDRQAERGFQRGAEHLMPFPVDTREPVTISSLNNTLKENVLALFMSPVFLTHFTLPPKTPTSLG